MNSWSHAIRRASDCAGHGRDLLSVVSKRPDADRVTACWWSTTTRGGPPTASRRGALRKLEVLKADTAQRDLYRDSVPVSLVLLRDILDNARDADVRTTIEMAPQLRALEAEVIWTCHRRDDPDLTASIRGRFTRAGFEEIAFLAPDEQYWTVTLNRLVAFPPPRSRPPRVHLLPLSPPRGGARGLSATIPARLQGEQTKAPSMPLSRRPPLFRDWEVVVIHLEVGPVCWMDSVSPLTPCPLAVIA